MPSTAPGWCPCKECLPWQERGFSLHSALVLPSAAPWQRHCKMRLTNHKGGLPLHSALAMPSAPPWHKGGLPFYCVMTFPSFFQGDAAVRSASSFSGEWILRAHHGYGANNIMYDYFIHFNHYSFFPNTNLVVQEPCHARWCLTLPWSVSFPNVSINYHKIFMLN